jgi:hypothetical protein
MTDNRCLQCSPHAAPYDIDTRRDVRGSQGAFKPLTGADKGHLCRPIAEGVPGRVALRRNLAVRLTTGPWLSRRVDGQSASLPGRMLVP